MRQAVGNNLYLIDIGTIKFLWLTGRLTDFDIGSFKA
jgi:hypothetical protein